MKVESVDAVVGKVEAYAQEARLLTFVLDFSPGSIKALEDYLQLLWMTDAYLMRTQPGNAPALEFLELAGAYFLEVLRRQHTGRWVLKQGGLIGEFADGKLSLDLAAFSNRSIVQDLPPTGLKEFYDVLCAEFSSSLDAKMKTLSEEARHLPNGFQLDYSPASIRALENMLEFFARALKENNERGEFLRKSLRPLTLQLGAYLGECIIRNSGGSWVEGSEEGGMFTLQLTNNRGSCFPVGKVSKRLEFGPEESVVGFYALVTGPPSHTQ